ncbi:hypothetical protein BASA81_000363 [Batrachochytrium salamandrivorans]|nr:hypothetical protein BASA81_000363 [Batrachochytrium salamandrivorans]
MEPSVVKNRWYDHVAELLQHAPSLRLAVTSSQANAELAKRAPEHFDELVFKLKRKRKTYQDDKLTEKVMRNGTMGDKIAAMALVVGDYSLDSLEELDRLIGLSSSKARREANLAQDAVRDLLVESLLPSDRRLQTIDTSLKQYAHLKLSNEIIAIFWFEHLLKQKVLQFCQALQVTAVTKRDELPHHRKLALQRTFDIVNEKPECEVFLLNILCSVSGLKQTNMNFHLLRKLVQANPQFQVKICQLLEAQAISSTATPSSQYDICCYLNQTIFHQSSADSQLLANRLMETYFVLFQRTSQNSEAEQETKLLSAILTGVNRAFPYASREMCTFKKDELMLLVDRTSLFATKTQALMLLFRMSKHESNPLLFDLVYKQVKTLEFCQSRKKQLFLNLLVQVLGTDVDDKRVIQQLTCLLQSALLDSASLSCASMFLCSYIMSKRRTELKHVITPGWEYDLLRRNYHPTCVAFASKIVRDEEATVLEYSGDPLLDFSLTNFLDKFIYRNPKEKQLENSAFGTMGRMARIGAKAFKQPAVNSEEFHQRFAQKRNSGKLGEESEMVFYKYFDTSGKKFSMGAANGRNVDLEAMEDEFADQLAERLLKKSAGGGDFDLEDEEELEFERQMRKEFGRGDVSDEEGEDADFDGLLDDGDADLQPDENNNDDDEDDDDEDDEDEDDDGEFDEDDEDDQDDEGEGLSVFADADDFAGMIEGSNEPDDYEKYVTNKKRPAPTPAASSSKKSKKFVMPKRR